MSGASVAVGIWGGGGDGGGYRLPFTVVQWQELEHQAMIYKYLVAGLPLPPDLVTAIQRSFEARFYNHPSLSYCSYYGKKFDPEPGRCRRTDGKKWRCSKDAHPDSKYCERHMHRGRNRSRKPVESLNKTSLSETRNTGSFQNTPSYSSMSSPYGKKLQTEPVSYGMDNNKEFRYIQGLTLDTDEHSEASALGLGCNAGSGTWRLMPSQVSSTKPNSGPSSAQQTMAHHASMSRQVKQEQQEVHPFFSEWPTTKESWSTLDGYDGSNKNAFSSTQLSISIPRASSNFSSGSGYSPNGA